MSDRRRSPHVTLAAVRWMVAASCLALSAGALAGPAYGAPSRTEAEQILEATGVRGGLIVHLACGDGRLTGDLGTRGPYLVHGLDPGAANVAKARTHLRERGLYGKVTVEHFAGRRLPYVDNLVNLLVAEDLGDVPMNEVMRVLAPCGVVCILDGGSLKKTVKPRPAGDYTSR